LAALVAVALLGCFLRGSTCAVAKQGGDKAKPLLEHDSIEVPQLGVEMQIISKELEEEAASKAQKPFEGVWSKGRSEVGFDELKQATSGFDLSLEIGDGGSCRVYRATVGSIPCAIKVLAENAAGWEAKQFTAEVNLLRRVQHPNLCRLYASSTDGPMMCLVLELMEGGALDKRLTAQPHLGWQQRVSIALDTCRGLDYLHSLSPPMIHRDVSKSLEPSNCRYSHLPSNLPF
jgi:serine/threonine protein kinase